MKGKETFIKVIEDPVLYAEDHNLIIVLFDLKKMFVKNKIRYRVIRLEALMIFLTLHQEKYGNKKNLNIFFLDSTDDYDLSSIPFEIRNMVNYSYLLSIFKNIKIPFPYVFLNPSVYLPRKSYPFFIDIINEINSDKMNKILIIHA